MSQKRSYGTAYRFSINFCAGVLVEDAENLFSKFHESIYAPTLVLRQKCRVYCYYFCFSVKQRNSKGMCMISARNVPEMPSIVWTPKRPRCNVLLHPERGQRPVRETSWRRPTLQAQNTNPPSDRWVAGRPRPQPAGAPLRVTVDNTKPKVTSNQCGTAQTEG